MKVSELLESRRLAAFCLILRRRTRKSNVYWVHPLNLLRPTLGEHLKVELMYHKYPDRFIQYTRMTPAQFDVLLNRFLIYKRPIHADPENVVHIVKATVALHNFLRTEELKLDPTGGKYCPPGYADVDDQNNGEWRSIGAFQDLRPNSKHNDTITAKQMRENLPDYFSGERRVPFQYERIVQT